LPRRQQVEHALFRAQAADEEAQLRIGAPALLRADARLLVTPRRPVPLGVHGIGQVVTAARHVAASASFSLSRQLHANASARM
jgi:hypothetical protein